MMRTWPDTQPFTMTLFNLTVLAAKPMTNRKYITTINVWAATHSLRLRKRWGRCSLSLKWTIGTVSQDSHKDIAWTEMIEQKSAA